jgi:oligopeptide/dipeptide ABC transporter ATP-binding protein
MPSSQPATAISAVADRDPLASVSPLIELRKVKKYYTQRPSLLERVLGRQKDKTVYAVDDISLRIYPGETLGLVGESGCGKSTLGRTAIGLHDATEGQVLYRNHDIAHLTGTAFEAYRQKNQMIFQNPYASLNPRKTVRQIVGAALRNRDHQSVTDLEQELRHLLEKTGLSQRHLDQYPHQFSGGQRQRIGIARALAMKPEFIVADEPVSALDLSVQAQIVNLLKDLQQENRLTYLFVAHDLSVVRYVSNRVAVMYLGQLVELADTDELFDNPLHPYTVALLSSIPVIDKQERRERIILQGNVSTPLEEPVGCRFQQRCPHKIGEICENVRPVWVESGGHGVACHLYPNRGEKI